MEWLLSYPPSVHPFLLLLMYQFVMLSFHNHRLQESEQMRLEANANANAKVKLLEEQVIQLKDLLEEWSTQME